MPSLLLPHSSHAPQSGHGLESGNLSRSSWETRGSVCRSGLPEEQGVHMQRVRAISRTGSVKVEARESCRLSGQQAAGPEQSRCCGSSARSLAAESPIAPDSQAFS